VTAPLVAAMVAFVGLGAAFHVYWACGGRIGRRVAVPQRLDGEPLFVPGALATLAVAVALALVALVLVACVGGWTFGLPRSVWQAGLAGLGLVFLARGLSWHPYFGLFKRVRSTDFARNDTWFYSPGCVLMGAGFLFLAWQG
jgi:hypothetical protein